MIYLVFNNMLTLMLAKFMLNDVPHAAGLLELNCSPAVLAPAYNVSKGTHSWGDLVSATPASARGAIMYAEILRRRESRNIPPLSLLDWQYTMIPVGSINGFVRTLAKYVKYSAPDIERLMRSFPLGDFFELSDEAEYYRPSWPYLSVLQCERMREDFKYALMRDVDRAQGIWRNISSEGVYWPPVLLGDEVVDGAHRLAAIRGYCGPSFMVYVWKGLIT